MEKGNNNARSKPSSSKNQDDTSEVFKAAYQRLHLIFKKTFLTLSETKINPHNVHPFFPRYSEPEIKEDPLLR